MNKNKLKIIPPDRNQVYVFSHYNVAKQTEVYLPVDITKRWKIVASIDDIRLELEIITGKSLLTKRLKTKWVDSSKLKIMDDKSFIINLSYHTDEFINTCGE